MKELPIYVLAGQSNANMMAVRGGMARALNEQSSDYVLFEGGVNGSSLTMTSAVRGDWNVNSEGELYDRMVDGVARAKADAVAAGRTPVVEAFFWIQGEADSRTIERASQYEANLTGLVEGIRADLGADVPIFVAELRTRAEGFTFHETVRAAQRSVAEAFDNVHFVDTDAFALKPDGLHYSSIGGRELARALVDAATALEGDGPASGKPTPEPAPAPEPEPAPTPEPAPAPTPITQSPPAEPVEPAPPAPAPEPVIPAPVAAPASPAEPAPPAEPAGPDPVRILGTQGTDALTGSEGKNTLVGRDGDDRLNGEGGRDQLKAGEGDDTLDGGEGNDRLFGNQGNDTLTGGGGTDRFFFTERDETDSEDTVTDFEVGTDFLILRGLDLAAVEQAGGDTVLAFEGGGTVTLEGVDADQLSERDFKLQAGADLGDLLG